MASSEDALAILGVIVAVNCLKTRGKKRKRVWAGYSLRNRSTISDINLASELRLGPKDSRHHLQMPEETYFELLSLVTPLIKKQDTVMRIAISPHERLTATLLYLATGRTISELKTSITISPQALGTIIPETCEAIYKVLHKDYLKFPQTEEAWLNIANDFEAKWNFPHCLGAMDGRHINIIPAGISGSTYLNYTGKHSMILLVIANAKYEFIMCDFGTNGCVPAGDMLKNSKFFKKLQGGKLNIPGSRKICKNAHGLPYVFIVDEAFPLSKDMMKPFSQVDLTSEHRKIYNYRVSRAKRVVENAFGILASRFKIFHSTINLLPRKIESIVMACCVLHNFLMKSGSGYYSPPDCLDRENFDAGTTILGLDTEDSSMKILQNNNTDSTDPSAQTVRDGLINYFVTDGQVPWQSNFI